MLRTPVLHYLLFLLLFCIPAALSLDRPPLFSVDLTLPPSERWAGAVALVLSRHPFESGFEPTFRAHNESLFDKLNSTHWQLLGDSVRQNYPSHAEELQSLSDQFTAAGHPVSYEYLCGWVYVEQHARRQ